MKYPIGWYWYRIREGIPSQLKGWYGITIGYPRDLPIRRWYIHGTSHCMMARMMRRTWLPIHRPRMQCWRRPVLDQMAGAPPGVSFGGNGPENVDLVTVALQLFLLPRISIPGFQLSESFPPGRGGHGDRGKCSSVFYSGDTGVHGIE